MMGSESPKGQLEEGLERGLTEGQEDREVMEVSQIYILI